MLSIKKTIKTIVGISPENISADILSSDQPLLLKGYGYAWPLVQASKKSTIEAVNYLKKIDNGFVVNACYLEANQAGRIFYNEDMTGFNFTTKSQTLSTVLTELLAQSAVENPKTIYVGSTSVQQVMPALIQHTLASPLLGNTIYNLWLGNKTKVSAHFDFLQNLACCVVGKRRFTLFPPEQVKNLYCGPLDKAPGGQTISMVDFDNPDLAKFPKFSDAINAAMVAELEAGDAILLPSMWWHHVEGLDEVNMLLNHWWRNSLSYMGNPTDALHHAILSIRDLPPAQRRAWQQLFNHYVFEHKEEHFSHINKNAKGILASPIDELQARKLRANLQNKLRR
jgi:hypothetical protein